MGVVYTGIARLNDLMQGTLKTSVAYVGKALARVFLWQW